MSHARLRWSVLIGVLFFAVLAQPAYGQSGATRVPFIGRVVYVGDDGNVRLLDGQSGAIRQVTFDAETPLNRYFGASISPDGRQIAYCASDEVVNSTTLYVADVETLTSRPIAQVFQCGYDWTTDSAGILFGKPSQLDWDTGSWTDPSGIWQLDIATGREFELIHGQSGFPHRSPDLSPDGAWMIFEQVEYIEGRGTVHVWNRRENTRHPTDIRGDSDWSPDGSLLATDEVNYVGRPGMGIRLMEPEERGNGDRIYSHPSLYAWQPKFSPDGRHIAFLLSAPIAQAYRSLENEFSSNPQTGDGFADNLVMVITTDGASAINSSVPAAQIVDWLPDGENLLLTHYEDDSWMLSLYNIKFATRTVLVEDFSYRADWGPSSALYQISGRIIDRDGNGIGDVMVTAGDSSAVADENGFYQLQNLMEGRYIVRPEQDGLAFLPREMEITLVNDESDVDFLGGPEPAALMEQIDWFVDATGETIDDLLAEANAIAEDGDYFLQQEAKDKYKLIADFVIGVFSGSADALQNVEHATTLAKMNLPLYKHLQAWRNANRAAHGGALLDVPITDSNASIVIRDSLVGPVQFFFSEAIDEAIDESYWSGLAYGLTFSISVENAFRNNLYPQQVELVVGLKDQLQNDAQNTLDNITLLSVGEERAFTDDLIRRHQANLALADAAALQSQLLHIAQDARETREDRWWVRVITKVLLRTVVTLGLDGAAPLVFSAADLAYTTTENIINLQRDIQMIGVAIQGMIGTVFAEGRIGRNAEQGLANIRNGVPPKFPESNVSVTNVSEGKYGVFGQWCTSGGPCFFQREAYSDLTVRNQSSYETLYQVLAVYEDHAILGEPSMIRIVEDVGTAAAGDQIVLRLYYRGGPLGDGVAPSANSAINMDILGTTQTGTYYIQRFGTEWSDIEFKPDDTTVLNQAASDQSVSIIDYPVWRTIELQEDDLRYGFRQWVTNPFSETLAASILAPVPDGWMVEESIDVTYSGGAMQWHGEVEASATQVISYVMQYDGEGSDTLVIPPATVVLSEINGSDTITFSTEADTIPYLTPLVAYGRPVTAMAPDSTAAFHVEVHNRDQFSERSGTLQVEIRTIEDEYQVVFTTARNVTLGPVSSDEILITLDSSQIDEGLYVIQGTLVTEGVVTAVFEEYLDIVYERIYLPLIQHD